MRRLSPAWRWAIVLSLIAHIGLLGLGSWPAITPATAPLRPILTATLQPQAVAPIAPATTAPRPKSEQPPRISDRKPATETAARVPPSAPANAKAPAESDDAPPAKATETNGEQIKAAKLVAERHFPRDAQLDYEVYYGRFLAGFGQIRWTQPDAHHYQLALTLRPVIGPRLDYLSHGQVGKSGLAPDYFEAKRQEERREYAEFDWAQGVLKYSQGSEPLQAGAQDILSLAFHIGLRAAAALDTPFQITTGRKVYRYPVHLTGEKTIQIGREWVRVLIASSVNDEERTEFWLAPDYHNLPVRIVRDTPDMHLEQRLHQLIVAGEVRLEPLKIERNSHGR